LRETTHDLRGNIDTMLSLANWMREGGDVEAARLLGPLVKGLDTSRRLVEELERLERAHPGASTSDTENVDVSATLSAACEACLPTAREKGLGLEWSGPARLFVRIDVTKLARIVQNLLLNAINHTDGGRVGVTWAPAGPTHGSCACGTAAPG
jgi:signal transduction histidine kinase